MNYDDLYETFKTVSEHYDLQGKFESYESISNGIINWTYRITCDDNGVKHKYVFQKINTYVFKNPLWIMSNIRGVTEHIAKKLDKKHKDPNRVMHFCNTYEGNNYYIDEFGGFWRVSCDVPNSVTFNTCQDLNVLKNAGAAFGEFQNELADFDASTLYETIPNFHNTQSRFDTLEEHIKEDIVGRVAGVKNEIERTLALKDRATKLGKLLSEGKIPLRVTHNDTKINNVLFDSETFEGKTVIDLDTVMPGLVAHDFGDAVRFAANNTAEDDPNLDNVYLDLDKYRAFAEGFVTAIKGKVEQIEIDTLALGALTITTELVVRFLDDYIVGDRYFKLCYPEHNLVRTRAQLKLAEDMLSKMDEMEQIISDIAK